MKTNLFHNGSWCLRENASGYEQIVSSGEMSHLRDEPLELRINYFCDKCGVSWKAVFF